MRFYRVPLSVRDDILALEKEVQKYKAGEITHDRFKGFRVPLGIYEQRQPDIYMVRIRVPGGGVSASQLKKVSEIAWVHGLSIHVTTRQDIQLHNAEPDHLVSVYKELLKVSLTPKGGGGNTIRNITACPFAGICPDEVFNVLPYSIALTEYLIAFQSSYNLPRKFKIAFSGCKRDCAFATVNDVGFVAKRRNGTIGFSVWAGGGMGAYSRIGEKLLEFVSVDEVGYVAEALKRLFDKYGNRKDRHRARLRFVLDRLGFVEFKNVFEQEYLAVKEEGLIDLEIRDVEEKREEFEVKQGEAAKEEAEEKGRLDPECGLKLDLKGSKNGYGEWKNLYVKKQKQDGYYWVEVPIALGDIDADRLQGLAKVVGQIGEGIIRSTQKQGFVLRWIKNNEIYDLYCRLIEGGLIDGTGNNIYQITTCKGTKTCKLGICFSGGLTRAITERLDQAKIRLVKFPEISLKVNGCPNACGQHPIATLGFAGAARRINGQVAPFYRIFVGGRVEEDNTRLGEPYGFLPAKNVPDFVVELLTAYKSRRSHYQDFYHFVDFEGRSIINELIAKHSFIPSYEEDESYYYDWSSDEVFSLQGRGAGECGAGVIDMIESDIEEAERCYELGDFYGSIAHLTRSLLVTKGLDPRDDMAAFALFRENFIEPGWVAGRYESLLDAANQFKFGGRRELLEEKREDILNLIERIKALYQSMDSNLQFQLAKEEIKSSQNTTEQPSDLKTEVKPKKILDLKGVACPINYVRAKMAIEELSSGDLLELFLDDGEPIENVPRSLESDGQEIIKIEMIDDYYRVLVMKGT
ncbi:MAG: sulfurtransferase TusA family protein [Actinobacteria bacterium]|nr:sulfurtransferase TusA family protein [Actinomycetota bacterium]